jgi:hypothetical protein
MPASDRAPLHQRFHRGILVKSLVAGADRAIHLQRQHTRCLKLPGSWHLEQDRWARQHYPTGYVDGVEVVDDRQMWLVEKM